MTRTRAPTKHDEPSLLSSLGIASSSEDIVDPEPGDAVAKHFPGYGWYNGEVKSCRTSSIIPGSKLYLVVFSDGDAEEYDAEEIKSMRQGAIRKGQVRRAHADTVSLYLDRLTAARAGIEVNQINPKQRGRKSSLQKSESNHAWERYECYKSARTVGGFFDLGGKQLEFVTNYERGSLRLLDPAHRRRLADLILSQQREVRREALRAAAAVVPTIPDRGGGILECQFPTDEKTITGSIDDSSSISSCSEGGRSDEEGISGLPTNHASPKSFLRCCRRPRKFRAYMEAWECALLRQRSDLAWRRLERK